MYPRRKLKLQELQEKWLHLSDLKLTEAEDDEMEFPIAALAVKRNFYMDDFFKSVESTDEAMEMQQKILFCSHGIPTSFSHKPFQEWVLGA